MVRVDHRSGRKQYSHRLSILPDSLRRSNRRLTTNAVSEPGVSRPRSSASGLSPPSTRPSHTQILSGTLSFSHSLPYVGKFDTPDRSQSNSSQPPAPPRRQLVTCSSVSG